MFLSTAGRCFAAAAKPLLRPLFFLTKIRFLLLLFFSLPAVTHKANAQGCCTVGSSLLGGFDNSVQTYHTLSLGLDYQFNSLTRAFEGSESIDDPLRRTATVAYFTLRAEYGLQPRLSILASLYYADRTRELTVESGQGTGMFLETAEFRGSGIGDVTLLAKYRLVSSSFASPFGLAVGAGASLPTGSYQQEQDGSQLSIDLQPGTGATASIGWTLLTYAFPEEGLQISLTGLYRYPGSNLDGYRIGDEIFVNLGAEKSLGEQFSVALILRSRYADKDFAGGRFLIGTGGTYHDLVPVLLYSEGSSLARLSGQLPIYRNVRGIQLAITYLLGVEYRYTFDFRDIVDVIVPEL